MSHLQFLRSEGICTGGSTSSRVQCFYSRSKRTLTEKQRKHLTKAAIDLVDIGTDKVEQADRKIKQVF